MKTLDTEHMTMNEFSDALLSARAGETIVYATGDLAFDRFRAKQNNHPNAAELSGVATMALAEAGYATFGRSGTVRRVHLTQRRLGANKFEYRATVAQPSRSLRIAAE